MSVRLIESVDNYVNKANALEKDVNQLINELRSLYISIDKEEDKMSIVQEIHSSLHSISELSKLVKSWPEKTLRISYKQDGTLKQPKNKLD